MKTVAAILLMTVLATVSHADPTVIPLWPEGVPGSPRAEVLGAKTDLGDEIHKNGGITNVSVPTLTV